MIGSHIADTARSKCTSILHLTARQRTEKARSLCPTCPGLSPGRAWKDPGNQGKRERDTLLGTAGTYKHILPFSTVLFMHDAGAKRKHP